MAEAYSPAIAGHNLPAEDNEQRIDGDGQEVNALRFLGAGGPPAPPPPAITPVTTGVSQPLQPPHQTQPPQPPQTPHQPTQAPQHQLPQQPMPAAGGYDYPDPAVFAPMQIPPGPMSGPYGMPGQVPGMLGGGPMMMMPPYNYMYPHPYYAMPGPYSTMPTAPSNSSQFINYLNILRVKDPKVYRDWYKKYSAHKRNPDRVPFPQIPVLPGVALPGSSQTLPYGRIRKDSSRGSVNGDPYRPPHNESFANLEYSHVPGNGANTSMSHAYPRTHVHKPHSAGTSINGDYRAPPEEDFEIDGADSSSLSVAVGNSVLTSSHYHQTDRDRPPTQSGRSSTVGEPYRSHPGDVYGGYPDQQYDSLNYDNSYRFQPINEQEREPSPRRMTPMKFSTFHLIAKTSPLGHLLRIKSSGTVLEFIKLKQFIGHLPEYKELESFPGPLNQESIHKNTVIQFCRRKIKEARSSTAQIDKDNYILLWEFLMLMLRQNGMVVGSDIAELLLNAVQEEKKAVEVEEVRDDDDIDGGEDEEVENSSIPEPPQVAELKDETKLVNEFCEHLLYGHKKDALEFAMDNGLWGHALFFASKMDEKSYGNVLARFANGIPLNSPLQTLYHIMCGKQPASVTICADETFGDWKPHLAMLLSNNGYKPEVEQKAILTLGDTLASRNHLYAAQFCYLMGHEEFHKESRLGPLLGYYTTAGNLLEATQMSEVYEFARKLADPHFSLGLSFLQSKLDYAKQLVSYGFVQEALAYCEEITKTIKARKIYDAELQLCTSTLQIAERIAVADETGSANTTWIEDLRKIIADPAIFSDNFRKLSLHSQEQNSQSDQLSYTSQSQPSHPNELYDPYGNLQTNPANLASDTHSLSSQIMQYDPLLTSTPVVSNDTGNTYAGTLEALPPENNWNNPSQMNGGLHISPPPMYDMNHQQSQTTVNSINSSSVHNNNMDANYPSLDGGYASGVGYDKMSAAAGPNNNYWYNPYESQPGVPNNDFANKEPDHNSAVKKKSVRFEDEHDRHADVENSLGNGVSALRSRIAVRPDSIDLKSAMKSSLNIDRFEVGSGQNCLNGGVDTIDQNGLDSSPEKSLLEVEYKSTYPIDEPIESVSRLSSKVRPSPISTYEFQNNKTFPIDKECCDVNEPCEDHDDYLGDGIENGVQDMTAHFTGYDKTEIKNPPPLNTSGKKVAEKKKPGKDILGNTNNQQHGWFSGLKWLSFKPKNQMILPDDKDPTIVWDPIESRWVNKIGGDDDDSVVAGPPPKDSELMGKPNPMSNGPMPPPHINMQSVPSSASLQTQHNMMSYQGAPAALQSLPMPINNQPSQNPGIMMVSQQQPNPNEQMIPGMPPVSNNTMNKYKLQKGRSLKNSYVDVLNPNGGVRAPGDPTPLPVNNMLAPQVPNMFIPPPTNAPGDGPVSFLTAPSEDVPVGQDNSLPQAPPMFNPAQFQNSGYPQGQ